MCGNTVASSTPVNVRGQCHAVCVCIMYVCVHCVCVSVNVREQRHSVRSVCVCIVYVLVYVWRYGGQQHSCKCEAAMPHSVRSVCALCIVYVCAQCVYVGAQCVSVNARGQRHTV